EGSRSYPAYEHLARLLLLEQGEDALVEAPASPEADDLVLAGAATLLASYDVVEYRKRLLARLDQGTFERLERAVAPEHAAAVRSAAAVAAAQRARGAPLPFGEPPWAEVVGISDQGALSGLACAGGSIFSLDGGRLVRFDPGSVVPVTLAEAPEGWSEL